MILIRIKQNAFAMYGTLTEDDGTPVCVTLELPWRNNQHNVSCIPAGRYRATRVRSPHLGYKVWLLCDVPQRENVEIHIGNLPKDTNGCILVGVAFGEVNGQPGIVDSARAFAALMTQTAPLSTLWIEIVDVAGGISPVPTQEESV